MLGFLSVKRSHTYTINLKKNNVGLKLLCELLTSIINANLPVYIFK